MSQVLKQFQKCLFKLLVCTDEVRSYVKHILLFETQDLSRLDKIIQLSFIQVTSENGFVIITRPLAAKKKAHSKQNCHPLFFWLLKVRLNMRKCDLFHKHSYLKQAVKPSKVTDLKKPPSNSGSTPSYIQGCTILLLRTHWFSSRLGEWSNQVMQFLV